MSKYKFPFHVCLQEFSSVEQMTKGQVGVALSSVRRQLKYAAKKIKEGKKVNLLLLEKAHAKLETKFLEYQKTENDA